MSKELLKSLIIVIIFITSLWCIIYFIRNNSNNTEGVVLKTSTPSYCLQILRQVNLALPNEIQWEAVEISMIGDKPVSLNNEGARRLQEESRDAEIQANYGPFIMEKREVKGGKFVQETNPELIKCARDKIILSVWQ